MSKTWDMEAHTSWTTCSSASPWQSPLTCSNTNKRLLKTWKLMTYPLILTDTPVMMSWTVVGQLNCCVYTHASGTSHANYVPYGVNPRCSVKFHFEKELFVFFCSKNKRVIHCFSSAFWLWILFFSWWYESFSIILQLNSCRCHWTWARWWREGDRFG